MEKENLKDCLFSLICDTLTEYQAYKENCIKEYDPIKRVNETVDSIMKLIGEYKCSEKKK